MKDSSVMQRAVTRDEFGTGFLIETILAWCY
jgi:hypothetical protein